MDQLCKKNSLHEALTGTVDEAISEAVKKRNHFMNWEERLKKALSASELNFSLEFLNTLSALDFISSNDIVNLAVKHDQLERYKGTLSMLKHNGYINNDSEADKYVFQLAYFKTMVE